MFKVPVLFLTFNRLDTAKQVFGQIKKQQPAKLYFASDGPRTMYQAKKKMLKNYGIGYCLRLTGAVMLKPCSAKKTLVVTKRFLPQ